MRQHWISMVIGVLASGAVGLSQDAVQEPSTSPVDLGEARKFAAAGLSNEEIALALATARRHMVGGRSAEAREAIAPLLIDPIQPSIDVWTVAAKIGLATQDANLAAYSLEALRIRQRSGRPGRL